MRGLPGRIHQALGEGLHGRVKYQECGIAREGAALQGRARHKNGTLATRHKGAWATCHHNTSTPRSERRWSHSRQDRPRRGARGVHISTGPGGWHARAGHQAVCDGVRHSPLPAPAPAPAPSPPRILSDRLLARYPGAGCAKCATPARPARPVARWWAWWVRAPCFIPRAVSYGRYDSVPEATTPYWCQELSCARLRPWAHLQCSRAFPCRPRLVLLSSPHRGTWPVDATQYLRHECARARARARTCARADPRNARTSSRGRSRLMPRYRRPSTTPQRMASCSSTKAAMTRVARSQSCCRCDAALRALPAPPLEPAFRRRQMLCDGS